MKLNKLLTLVLGLATLSTIVAPITTSCSSETIEEHIKVSPKSLEVNAKNSIATYLLVLDRNDYDIHGFKVTTTVSKDDKTGVVDSDFESEWEIDGDHLVVYVTYVGETEPEEDITVKLNINVSYGTQWSKTLDVKMGYEILKPDNMTWYDRGYYRSNYVIGEKGMTYAFSADCSYIDQIELKNRPNSFWVSILGSLAYPDWYAVGFKSVVVKLNGKTVTKDGNYSYVTSNFITTNKNIIGVNFTDSFIEKLGKGDTLTLSFEDCGAYHGNLLEQGYQELDSLDIVAWFRNK